MLDKGMENSFALSLLIEMDSKDHLLTEDQRTKVLNNLIEKFPYFGIDLIKKNYLTDDQKSKLIKIVVNTNNEICLNELAKLENLTDDQKKMITKCSDDNHVANHEGEYENFTGKINWKKIFGQVENATFELKNGEIQMVWKDGTWKQGECHNAKFNGGTWENGYADENIFYNVTWKDGVWENGCWKGGTWENGEWRKGIEPDHTEHGKGDSPDKWKKLNNIKEI